MSSPDLSELPLRRTREELLTYAVHRGSQLQRRTRLLRLNGLVVALAVTLIGAAMVAGGGRSTVTTVDEPKGDGTGVATTSLVPDGAPIDAVPTTSAVTSTGARSAAPGAAAPAAPGRLAPASADTGAQPEPSAAPPDASDDDERRSGHAWHDHEHIECIVIGGFMGSAGSDRDVAGECWYVPDGDGGYVATGRDWVIELTRDGRRTVLDGRVEPLCQPVGFFRSGDNAIVRAAPGTTISVGKEHGC